MSRDLQQDGVRAGKFQKVRLDPRSVLLAVCGTLIGSHLFPCPSCFIPIGGGSGLTLFGPLNIYSFYRLLNRLLLLLELFLVLVGVVVTRLMVCLAVAVIIVYYYRFYYNVQYLYILGSDGVSPDLQSWSALGVCSGGSALGCLLSGPVRPLSVGRCPGCVAEREQR